VYNVYTAVGLFNLIIHLYLFTSQIS